MAVPVSDRQGKGDVIYRQDAIRVLGAQCKDKYNKTCGEYCECMEYMALRDTPSANTDMSSYSDKLWHLAHERGIREAQQQWIPCSERLPERNGYYLVTGRQGAVNKRLYQDGYWYGNWAIIAWMPLPEPYKGENAND